MSRERRLVAMLMEEYRGEWVEVEYAKGRRERGCLRFTSADTFAVKQCEFHLAEVARFHLYAAGCPYIVLAR